MQREFPANAKIAASYLNVYRRDPVLLSASPLVETLSAEIACRRYERELRLLLRALGLTTESGFAGIATPRSIVKNKKACPPR